MFAFKVEMGEIVGLLEVVVVEVVVSVIGETTLNLTFFPNTLNLG
jgi:hypothetical protein